MSGIDRAALDGALDRMAQRFKGPGGVAGVVLDGQVIARRAWGYADLNRRLPMTARTLLPICSITKQFTCAVLLDQFRDLAVLDARVADYLPQFRDALPTVRQLCDNQSGLRDTWALTVLQGAVPEAEFRREDALPLIARMKSGHFAPGSAYSYSNGNYRLLAEMIETATGRDLGTLYADRIFGPAGLETAVLLPDTRVPADGVVGYEGNDDVGFLPAVNGIYWTGDAGLSASLDDMLAWESHIDATRNDPDGLYARLSVAPNYADGSPAQYGFGLRHDVVAGQAVTCHGGALRGFRAHRLHAAGRRLSVVVMFNHEANAQAAAASLLAAAVGHSEPAGTADTAGWDGLWLDEAQGLVARTTADPAGVTLRYGTGPVRLTVGPDGMARGAGIMVSRDGDRLLMRRGTENLIVNARPLRPVDHVDGAGIAGRYWSDELDAALVIDACDGATFAGFDGMLGSGPMERMYPVGQDVWIITSRRSMDAAPPGDWTVWLHRDAAGAVSGLTLGCWLARRIGYRLIG